MRANRPPQARRWNVLANLTPEQLPYGEACIANDPSHCERIHRIVTRNRYEPNAIAHDGVLGTMSRQTKAGFLKCPDCLLVVHTGQLRHCSDGDFDLSNFAGLERFIYGHKVFANGVLNVLQRFLFRGSL